MRFGERVLNSAERKFGGLALPGILKWIAGFQLMGLCLVMFSQGFAEMVEFDQAKILKGEVWRLISWVFLPTWNRLLFLIMVLFMFFINDVLEENLGTFRFNVLVISTLLFLTIAGMVPFPQIWMFDYHSHMRMAFLTIMVLTAAIMIPDYIIHLWMIIPIKMKWIGWMDVAIILGTIFTSANVAITAVLFAIGFIPFYIGILPPVLANLKNASKATARRAKFQRDSGKNDGEAFHSCHNCGITDAKDPTMEFRVSSDDGNEYCLPCRERRTGNG